MGSRPLPQVPRTRHLHVLLPLCTAVCFALPSAPHGLIPNMVKTKRLCMIRAALLQNAHAMQCTVHASRSMELTGSND